MSYSELRKKFIELAYSYGKGYGELVQEELEKAEKVNKEKSAYLMKKTLDTVELSMAIGKLIGSRIGQE